MDRRTFAKLLGAGAVAGPKTLADAAVGATEAAGAVAHAAINAPATGGALGVSETLSNLYNLAYSRRIDLNLLYSGLDSVFPKFDLLSRAIAQYDDLKNAAEKHNPYISDDVAAVLKTLYSLRLQQDSLTQLLASQGLLPEHQEPYQKMLSDIDQQIDAFSKKIGRPIACTKDLEIMISQIRCHEEEPDGESRDEFLTYSLMEYIQSAGGNLLYHVRNAIRIDSTDLSGNSGFSYDTRQKVLKRLIELDTLASKAGIEMTEGVFSRGKRMGDVLRTLCDPTTYEGSFYHNRGLTTSADSRNKLRVNDVPADQTDAATSAIEGAPPNDAPRLEVKPAKAEEKHLKVPSQNSRDALLNQEFGDRHWTGRHEGRLPPKDERGV